MIVFENPGEIDAASISTFGVSVKESENPIGFFGTGLKYAIAILLRTGHDVKILSGNATFEFGTKTVAVRGKEFQFITMNGDVLGFTTEIGKTWEPWMAYRELYCNARDEYGDTVSQSNEPEPCTGHTFVVVRGRAIETVHAERWRYFIEDEPDMQIGTMQIWRRQGAALFYRGIRVMSWPTPAMFTYNETAPLELTEDRTLKNSYDGIWRIARALLRCEDEDLLRRVLTADQGHIESQFDFHGWNYITPSPTFLKTVGQLVNEGLTNVNATALKLWEEKCPREFQPREVAMTDVQRKTLERALGFCERIGFPIRESYPVRIVESLGTDTLGLADKGTIYVAERAFHMGGAKQVASTLIEEYVHLRHSYKDCTRPMQNWLFERMVSLGEEVVGEPL